MSKHIIHLLQTLLLCTAVLFQGCGPSEADIEMAITDGNYQDLHEYIASEIENGTASLGIFGYDDPTTFERATLAVLTNPNQGNIQTATLLQNNMKSISNSAFLPMSIWTTLLDNGSDVPQGLHEYYYRWYESNESSFKSDLKTNIETRLSADSGFYEPIKANRSNLIAMENPTMQHYRRAVFLSELIGDDKTISILQKVIQLHEQREEIEDELSAVTWGKYNQNNRNKKQADKTNELNNELLVMNEFNEAFIFSGLMIARLGTTGFSELYEVRDQKGTIYILSTTETIFSSKGNFRMRVIEGGEVPMQLKEEYGGFNRNVIVLREVTDAQWEKFQAKKAELEQSKSISKVEENRDYDAQIISYKEKLVQVDKEISDLLAQI